jgi:hypothetical protein
LELDVLATRRIDIDSGFSASWFVGEAALRTCSINGYGRFDVKRIPDASNIGRKILQQTPVRILEVTIALLQGALHHTFQNPNGKVT